MTRAQRIGGVVAVVLVLGAGYVALRPDVALVDEPAPATPASGPEVEAPGFLYGRVVTTRGEAYEGRLRFGGTEEAFWTHTFDGTKNENPWAEFVTADALTEARAPLRIFGLEISRGERPMDLRRPFRARFGDIVRIEARDAGVQEALERGREYDPIVRVVLKSGTVVDLDRNAASDFDDGLRVWDAERGVVNLGAREIRSIDFLPTPPLRDIPDRLFGTVETSQGMFTGFLQWNREVAASTDALVGRTDEGEMRLSFEDIAAISRQPGGGSAVTLTDGREIALSGTPDVDEGNRGVYVEDSGFGRVLVPWEAFERATFAPSDSGPGYEAFAPGLPLRGVVTTRDGRRLSGRLVIDLDESETTDMLDAPSGGVERSIPLDLIESLSLAEGNGPFQAVLRTGETVELEREGDLGESSAGVLVFREDAETPEYVLWDTIARLQFEAGETGSPPPRYRGGHGQTDLVSRATASGAGQNSSERPTMGSSENCSDVSTWPFRKFQ
ncbi:MAG: hypothetical protein AAGI52_16955 [Bacteroidota bacterium]